jgi:hypothetical protein
VLTAILIWSCGCWAVLIVGGYKPMSWLLVGQRYQFLCVWGNRLYIIYATQIAHFEARKWYLNQIWYELFTVSVDYWHYCVGVIWKYCLRLLVCTSAACFCLVPIACASLSCTIWAMRVYFRTQDLSYLTHQRNAITNGRCKNNLIRMRREIASNLYTCTAA